MSAAALTTRHDNLLPRPPGGNGPGALLALAVHAGLVVALTVSVDWRSQPTDVVAAELWASVPQVAAPPPPPPAPEPRPEPRVAPPPPAPPPPRSETQPNEADIAIERAERRKAEADKKKREDVAEAERKKIETDKREAEKKKEADKKEADKKKREEETREAREAAAAQDKRLAEQREANLRRMMGDAATAANGRSAGTAAQDAAPSAAYAGRVAALIRRASVFTGSVPGNPAAEVEVRASPSGTILSWRIVKSSGHKAWDDAVLQAIEKTGTLPRDTDGRVPAQMIINFRPKDE